MADDQKPWEKYAAQQQQPPWEKYAQAQGAAQPAEAPAPPSNESLDYAKEIGQGALNVLGGVGASVFEPIATVQKLATGHVNPTLQELATPPEGPAGKLGYVGGEAGQFLLPGGLEEKAETKIGEALANAPKLVRGAAKLLPTVASTAAVNTLQGGSPEAGAAFGLGGGLLGKVGEAVAPKLAESSLGVTNKMRAFGKTPGKAIIEETKGYSPAAVEESAHQAMNKIGSQLADAYRQAGQNGQTVSLQPALQIIQDNWQQARNMRNPEAIKAMEDLANRLTTSFSGTGNAVQMSPEELWNVKRGLGIDTNWNPNVDTKWLQGVRRKVYGAIDQELDKAVPETASLNQRYSSLKPVAKRADIESRNADIPQRMIHLMRTPTGALVRTGFGGMIGYKEGGNAGIVPGMIGATLGPELLFGPESTMFYARNASKAGPLFRTTLPLVRQVTQGSGR